MQLIGLSEAEFGALLVVLAVGALYVLGRRHSELVGSWADLSFALGLATSAILLASPLDRFAGASQTGHMAQHMLLAFLVAPLLVKGEMAPVIRAAISRFWDRRAGIPSRKVRTLPVGRPYAAMAWLGFTCTMIFWHLPRPFTWMATDEIVRALENLCFVVSGYLFWSVPLNCHACRILGDGVAVMFCASAIAVTDLVGAVMTLSRRLLYEPSICRSETIGLTQLQDQQLAGITMWIPGTLVLLVFFGLLFPAWLRRSEQQTWSIRQTKAPM